MWNILYKIQMMYAIYRTAIYSRNTGRKIGIKSIVLVQTPIRIFNTPSSDTHI